MSEVMFEDALKGSRAFNLISNDFRLGLGHAYMVVSNDDEIVKEFFSLLAAAAFCESKSACLNCTECLRAIHDNNPDITHFNREGESIKVDAVKELSAAADIRSFSGTRLFFVYRADLMNAAAQNKLLKTLEEPPEGVSFFLGVSNESAMLETVKSRCRKVYMDVFDDQTIKKALVDLGCEESIAKIATTCSEGTLGNAVKIARSPEYVELYRSAVKLLFDLKRSTDILAISRLSVLNNDTDKFLDVLSIILRNMLVLKAGKDEELSKLVGEDIKTLSESFSPLAISEIIKRINLSRRKLSLNINSTATIDWLLFGILEDKFKWQ